MNARTGYARIWLGPDPQNGSHTNIVGDMVVDELGAHVSEGSAASFFSEGEWTPDGVFFFTELDQIIPWHRIYGLDWLDDSAYEDAIAKVEELSKEEA